MEHNHLMIPVANVEIKTIAGERYVIVSEEQMRSKEVRAWLSRAKAIRNDEATAAVLEIIEKHGPIGRAALVRRLEQKGIVLSNSACSQVLNNLRRGNRVQKTGGKQNALWIPV